MSKRVQIGLLSPFFKPIKGYEQAAKDLDLNLVIVQPQKIDWQEQKVESLLYNGQAWNERIVPIPRSFYNRYFGPKPLVVDKLENIIGKNKIFNHITSFDKWLTYQALVKSALNQYLPESIPYTPQTLLEKLHVFKKVVIKPMRGQLGKKIYLVTKNQNTFYLHYNTKFPVVALKNEEDFLVKLNSLVNKDYLIQQYIPFASVEDRVFDLRFLVQKDNLGLWQMSGALSRVALRYSYITNLVHVILRPEEVLSATFPQLDLLPQLINLSIEAAQTIERSFGSLGEISVDFALDNKGNIWIIELNSKPMKMIFSDLKDTQLFMNIYRHPLLYARYLTFA